VKGSWLSALAAALAVGLAAAHLGVVADAAHDAGVARALGLDPQPWGALDVPLAALLSWLPVGTLAARAAMGQALVLGVAALAIYAMAQRLLAASAGPRPVGADRAGAWVGAVIAFIGTTCVVLGPVWQLEGGAPAGSALAALLAVLPIVLLAEVEDESAQPSWRLAAFALALAFGQDPLAGVSSFAACVVLVAAGRSSRQALKRAWASEGRALLLWAATGLLPLGLAVARTRAAGLPLWDALLSWGAAERGQSSRGAPWPFVQREVGSVLTVLAVAGAVLSLLVGRARPLAAALVALAVAGLSCGWAGAALGPARFGAPVLAATAAIGLLAAVSMQALVRAIAEARVPLSKASAAMVLVLELVAPVDAADEAQQRAAARARGGGVSPESPAMAWDDVAWGTLPPRSIVLVTDARIWRRAQAARATGALRGDIAAVPTLSGGTLAARFLAQDTALVPLWRDLALSGAPTESSLSGLASARPLLTTFDAAWGKALGKHLVPSGLLDRFEPEPRGASDRRKALEAFTPRRERLARAVVRDIDLADASAFLLRQRVLDLSSSGDRDLVGGAVADLDAFAPGDATGAQVVAHLVQPAAGKGPRPTSSLRQDASDAGSAP
jgi:hypothetical protein